MPTDGLAAIRARKQRARTGVGLHLIGHEDGEIELLGRLRQLAEVDIELLLALAQLTAAGVVDAEESADAVDDEQAVLARGELLGDLQESVVLVLAVLGADVGDVLVGGFWVDAEALCYLDDAFRAEGALGV